MESPSNSTTTVETCLYFCTTPKNQTTGYCPDTCLPICPSTCHFSLPLLTSPPYSNYLQPSHKNLPPLLISMLTVLASAFLLITFYVLYIKLYSHFYDQTRPNPRPVLDQDHGGDHPAPMIFHPVWYIPTVGLSADAINAVEVRKYRKGEELGGAVECTVCLAEFEENEELRILPKCNHAFHIHCIDTWLKSHTNCPLCRAPVAALDCDRTGEDSVPPSLTVSSAVGNSSLAEVRINVEELREINNNNNNNNNKEKSSSSTSQRWRSERVAANLLSRSFSCGANIFSSRYIDNNNDNNNNNNNI